MTNHFNRISFARRIRTAPIAALGAAALLLCPTPAPAAPPTTIYAAGNQGVFKSTDGGNTWTGISSFNLADSIAIDPQNVNTIYVGVSGGIYKTNDGGGHWNKLTNGFNSSNVSSIVIDPAHPNTIYAGLGILSGGGVLKSTDGGQHFHSVNTGLTAAPGGYLVTTALGLDPLNVNTLYVTGNTGMNGAKTTDAAANWTPFASPGGGLGLAIDPVHDNNVYYSGPWGITKTTTGGNPPSTPWTVINSGPFLALAIDPTATGTVYGGSFSCNPCTVSKSTDGGTTWTPSAPLAGSRQINALAVDPANPSTVYAADLAGVYRSTDGGATWTGVDITTPHNTMWALAMEPNSRQAAAFNLFESLAQNTINLANNLSFKPALACGVLQSFASQLPGLISSDTLSSSQGAGIEQQIQAAQAALNCH